MKKLRRISKAGAKRIIAATGMPLKPGKTADDLMRALNELAAEINARGIAGLRSKEAK